MITNINSSTINNYKQTKDLNTRSEFILSKEVK